MRPLPSFLSLALSALLAAVVAVPAAVAGTVSNPSEPTLSFGPSAWGREGTGAARTFQLAATVAPVAAGEVSFRVRTVDGSARAGEDYEAVDRVVTIPAGEARSATIAVRTVPDDVQEQEESFSVEVSEVDGARAGESTATLTIADDDTPPEPGDVAAFGCVAKPDVDDRCEIETAGLDFDISSVALSGERDLYVTDGVSIAHLRRDPATEQLTPAGCWVVRTEDTAPTAGCEDLPRTDGAFPFASTGVNRLAASPDGRHLYAEVGAHLGGNGVATFAIGKDGQLTLSACVGDPSLGPACTGPSGLDEAPTAWSTVTLSRDGRHLYVLAGTAVRLLRIGADGRPGSFRCADSGAPAAEGGCAPLLTGSDQIAHSALSPDGTRLAVAERDRLRTFGRDAATGTLTLQRTVAAPIGPASLAWAPGGDTFYVPGDAGAGTLLTYDAATLEQTACIASEPEPGTGEPGCAATTPAALRTAAALTVAPDGRDVYVVVSGGGIVSLRRDAGGLLSGGRCHAPATDAGPCGDGSNDPFPMRLISELAIVPSGRTLFANTSRSVNRFLRIERASANRAPVCSDADVGGRPGRALRVPLTCVDLDGDPVTVRVTGDPQHGTLSGLDSDGVAYQPAGGFRGADAIRFRATDGRADSAEATARIAIGNHAPICSAQPLRLRPGQLLALPFACSDPDGDRVAVEVARGPAHGSLDRFAYTAPTTWHGRETVLLRARDEWDATELSAPVEVVLAAPWCTSQSIAPLSVLGTRVLRRTLSCSSDGFPATVAIARQTGELGRAKLQGATLTFTPHRAPAGERDRITLAVTGDDGQKTTVAIEAAVPIRDRGDGTRAPSGDCRAPCTPDRQGEVTLRFVCDGRSVASAGACSGTLVIILCTNGFCRPARAVITASASARRTAPRQVRLGTARVRARAGRAVPVKVRLSRSARRLLASRGRLKAMVVLQLRRPGGRTRTIRRVITIRAPRRGATRPATAPRRR